MIIATLATMIFSNLSKAQTINDSLVTLKKTTLVKIIKESKKCASIKDAYKQLDLELKSLILDNSEAVQEIEQLLRDKEFNQEQIKRTTEKIHELNKQVIKAEKRAKTTMYIGGAAIIVTAILLSR